MYTHIYVGACWQIKGSPPAALAPTCPWQEPARAETSTNGSTLDEVVLTNPTNELTLLTLLTLLADLH